jgi:hypothetical protein
MQRDASRQQGQAIALLAIALAAIVAGVAIVVDGGYAFAERRQSQNAADFAAMAGTRVVGQHLVHQSSSAGNVTQAIQTTLAANDAVLESATYIDEAGNALGNVVGASSIPGNAFGVVVEAKTQWQPFLLGLVGITDWEAAAVATAKSPGTSLGGGVMPVGVEQSAYDGLAACPLTDLDNCLNQGITPGILNGPGQFGWLKFGIQGSGGKCDWTSSLGMLADGGCQTSKTFLDSQIGPPADSHGCCTSVGQTGSVDLIGGLTGNEWGDLSFYIDNGIPVWVPVWDSIAGNGANASYHIVGFGAIVFTGDNEHAKWLEGAALEGACDPGTEITGHDYCTTPGGPFILDATGEVFLIN